MKDSGIFVSIGRGLVVDEDALAGALKAGQIRGAGVPVINDLKHACVLTHSPVAALDVFKAEPLPEASPLWDCDNVLLTSHNGRGADRTP